MARLKPPSRRTWRRNSTTSPGINAHRSLDDGLDLLQPLDAVVANPLSPLPTIPASTPLSASGSGPRYLGFTSHSTVFEETRHSLSLLHGPGFEHIDANAASSSTQDGISFHDLPPTIRSACLYVLQHLPGQPNEQMTFTNGLDNSYEPKGWAHIAVADIVRSLQLKFGTRLDGDAHPERMAEQICTNTTRPLRDIHTGPREWLDQFCGPDTVRWESLGLLWAYLERISDALDSLRSRHLAWVPGRRSAEIALRCLCYCIDISLHLNEGNDLLLDLCRRKGTLESMTAGDASKFSIVMTLTLEQC
jgi:hypothetical protein